MRGTLVSNAATPTCDPDLRRPHNAPRPEQRLAARESPATRPIGRQRWRDLLFLHWKVPAPDIQASLPRGLSVDTYNGDAYLGVVPFFMEGVRFGPLPAVPGISNFLELNVRTYVHDADGTPGVWFYSLDCNQPLAVWVARRFFHLPYFHARMSARRHRNSIAYESQRRGGADARDAFTWEAPDRTAPATPGSLEFFLVERYILFSINRSARLRRGRVQHAPYEIAVPRVSQFSVAVARLAGFELAGPPDSALAARRVDVGIHPLERAAI